MFFMSGKTKIRTARLFFNKSWPKLSVGTHIIGVEASAYVLRRLVFAFLNKDLSVSSVRCNLKQLMHNDRFIIMGSKILHGVGGK